MELANISLMLVYGAMAAYTVAMISFWADLVSRSDSKTAANIGMSVIKLAFALHVIAVVTRGIAASRVPWANMYEFTLTASCVATGAFLYYMRGRYMRGVGAFLAPIILLSLGLAVAVYYVQVAGTPPILDSYWLVIHVSTAILGTGFFGISALFSALQLYQIHAEKKATVPVSVGASTEDHDHDEGPSKGRLLANLPSSAELEQRAFSTAVIGFLLWTFTLIAGAIWAEHSWGRPWNWDPKETMTLVVWFFYAAYLHTRTTHGWSGKRAAWLCLAGFAALLFNYYGINLFVDSVHSYSGV